MIFTKIFILLFCFLSPQTFSSEKCKKAAEGIIEQDFDISLPTEQKINPVLFYSIEETGLPSFTKEILQSVGIHYVGDLARYTEPKLREKFRLKEPMVQESIDLKEVGQTQHSTIAQEISRQIENIKKELSKINLKLGMDIEWPSNPKEVEALIKKHKQKIGAGAGRGEWA